MRLFAAILIAVASTSAVARADDPPVEPTAEPVPAAPAPGSRAGITLPAGGLQIMLALEMSFSKDAVFKPFSVAPDVTYGVTDDFTLILAHSGFNTTGFRGNVGRGLCLAGESKGCPKTYDNVGLSGLYNLLRGPFALAAEGGLYFVKLDPSWLDVKLGARMRYSSGPFVATFSPSVLIGVTKRDDGNKGSLFLPASVGYKITPALLASFVFGIKSPDISHLGETWVLALGVNGTYVINPHILVGASFVFGEIAGSGDLPDTAKGVDRRYVQVWGTYTL